MESLSVPSDKYGTLTLDRDPDLRLVLQLSADLKLDEIHCAELLCTAEKSNMLMYEAAAGVYFSDRLVSTA